MGHKSFPDFTLNLDHPLLINPILHYYSILQKSEPIIAYNNFLGKPRAIVNRIQCYPIYLSEIGKLLALDITSQNLDELFFSLTNEFNGTYTNNEILISKLYNYDKTTNRVVSWGQIDDYTINQDLCHRYRQNLTNDFMLFPSMLTNQGFYSPNRCFQVDASTINGPYFKANINYNVGVIFLKPDYLKEAKQIKIWANQELSLYETPAGFVEIEEDGYVKYKQFKIHFPRHPYNLVAKVKEHGEYFLGYIISYNEYRTSFWKCPYSGSFNINIVERLSKFGFTKHEILRLLFPKFMTEVNMNSLVLKWKVPKKTVSKAFSRMMKFSKFRQRSSIADEIMGKINRLVSIDERSSYYKVRTLNPSVIPYLIRKRLTVKTSSDKRGIDKVILSEDPIGVLEKLRGFKEKKWKKFLSIYTPVEGIESVISQRAQLTNYLKN